MRSFEEYPFEIQPLAAEEGGGYLITFPDLPGCMSDGESLEQAMANGRDAFEAWMAASADAGLPVPEPGEGGKSGRFVARVPKSLHARLQARAKAEGVSMNTLLVALLSESVQR